MKKRHAQREQKGRNIQIRKSDHILGNPNAPVTLLEYGDYECPHCGEAHWTVKALHEALGDNLRYVYRNFPLTEVHPHAETAAEAVEAAGVQGRFWEMHDAVFENQDALEEDDLATYAADVGLDANKVVAEIEGGAYRDRIQEDIDSGNQLGVDGTPAFFINGQSYEGATIPTPCWPPFSRRGINMRGRHVERIPYSAIDRGQLPLQEKPLYFAQ
jgi:protein-disulfide isomerase